MTTFSFTTGNPSNLTAGATASMTDISGPFTDLRTFLNGASIDSTNIAAGPTLIATQQAWQTIALAGFTAANLSYYKDSLGTVHFKGDSLTAASPGAGTTLCTLPAGYRPVTTIYLPLTRVDGTASVSTISIDTAGLVKNIAGMGTQAFSFGACHFRAEN